MVKIRKECREARSCYYQMAALLVVLMVVLHCKRIRVMIDNVSKV